MYSSKNKLLEINIMKRIIITTLCALACLASAIAQIGYRQDDITYSLNTDKSGNNYAIALYNLNKDRSNVVIPETITFEGTDYTVTEIGDEAFANNAYLESVSLPNTLLRIGDKAFYLCGYYRGYLTINWPESLTYIGKAAFRRTKITTVKIPGTVQIISDEAFKECIYLKTVDIGYGVKSIGAFAFNLCSEIQSITIPSSVETIGDYAFCNCQALKSFNLDSENIRYIGIQAFYNCKLENISLPNSLTTICDRAFANNTLPYEIFIPENVTKVGQGVFSGCSRLKRIAAPSRLKPTSGKWFDSEFNSICWYDDDAIISKRGIIYSADYSRLVFVPSAYPGVLNIPSSTTSIGAYAAYQCSHMLQVKLPTSLKEIEPYAFSQATGLGSVDLPDIKYIGQSAFYDTFISDLSINENIDSIGYHAFYGLCDFIFPLGTSADIMKGAFCCLYKFACGNDFDYEKVVDNSVGYNNPPYRPVFYDEIDIVEDGMIFNSSKNIIKYASYTTVTTEYTIPASVTEIGDNAFYSCTKLSTLTIPEGVKSIGKNTFGDCMIETLHLPASLTSIGSNAFVFYPYSNSNPSIYYNSTVPMSGDKNIFKASDYNEAILYIPKGTSGKFLITSPWMYFRNIQEIDFSGIDGVESDECGDAPVEYYNLQGIRVENPESGLYIRRQGNKSTKVYIP